MSNSGSSSFDGSAAIISIAPSTRSSTPLMFQSDQSLILPVLPASQWKGSEKSSFQSVLARSSAVNSLHRSSV